MDQLTLGVVGTSRKPNELRRAIHPAHFERIDPELRRRMFVERGYGAHFGVSDDELAPLVGGMRSREELFAECDVVLLPKPLADDLETLRPGQVVWGWPHCVQDRRMTQLAIDRELTLIACEAMNHWTRDGPFQPPRVPQEQRARRLLLGAARAAAGRLDRGLRPPPARRGDQLRRHRAAARSPACPRSASPT